MKNWKKILSYVLVALVSSALTLTVSVGKPYKLRELESLLQYKFVDGADSQKLQDAAANAMVEALGDRWSYYISAEEFPAHVEQKNNAYVGIGITIKPEDSGYVITKTVQGGPAEEAGLQAGDVLIAVDGVSIVGMPTQEGAVLVRGEEGTQVDITVLRGTQVMTVTVTRRSVKTPVATGTLLQGNVGLISITNFNSNCYAETKSVLEDLLQQGAQALIFDVRFNPGGYAHELVRVLDYLLPEGNTLFHTMDYTGREDLQYSDAQCLEMPMAVLVNGDSYSAAEFFAAALQEYDWAIVVGEKTVGKGHYQQTFQLSDGSAVAVSTGKYFTPKGVSLEGVGITPDVEIAITEEMAAQVYAGNLPPEEDLQIIAAINALNSAK